MDGEEEQGIPPPCVPRMERGSLRPPPLVHHGQRQSPWDPPPCMHHSWIQDSWGTPSHSHPCSASASHQLTSFSPTPAPAVSPPAPAGPAAGRGTPPTTGSGYRTPPAPGDPTLRQAAGLPPPPTPPPLKRRDPQQGVGRRPVDLPGPGTCPEGGGGRDPLPTPAPTLTPRRKGPSLPGSLCWGRGGSNRAGPLLPPPPALPARCRVAETPERLPTAVGRAGPFRPSREECRAQGGYPDPARSLPASGLEGKEDLLGAPSPLPLGRPEALGAPIPRDMGPGDLDVGFPSPGRGQEEVVGCRQLPPHCHKPLRGADTPGMWVGAHLGCLCQAEHLAVLQDPGGHMPGVSQFCMALPRAVTCTGPRAAPSQLCHPSHPAPPPPPPPSYPSQPRLLSQPGPHSCPSEHGPPGAGKGVWGGEPEQGAPMLTPAAPGLPPGKTLSIPQPHHAGCWLPAEPGGRLEGTPRWEGAGGWGANAPASGWASRGPLPGLASAPAQLPSTTSSGTGGGLGGPAQQPQSPPAALPSSRLPGGSPPSWTPGEAGGAGVSPGPRSPRPHQPEERWSPPPFPRRRRHRASRGAATPARPTPAAAGPRGSPRDALEEARNGPPQAGAAGDTARRGSPAPLTCAVPVGPGAGGEE